MKRTFVLTLAIAVGLSLGVPAMASSPPVWETDFGTGLNQFDDDCDYVPLGFTFTFYGVDYDHVWVNSNGNVTFNGCNRSWSSPDIPEGSLAIIGPLYGDFNPWVGGDVYYNTLGTSPDQRFVVTWYVVPEYSPYNTGHSTFQMQLFESSNAILLGYNGLRTDGINWNGATMDVGISSGTGMFINSASGTAIPGLDMTNICYVPSGSGYVEIMGPCLIEVDLDIKPGSDPNSINTKAKGVIPMAILGSAAFDVTAVDVTTLLFEGAAPSHDLTDPLVYADHLQDVDGDGYLDLVVHVKTQDTGLAMGDIEGCLEGMTLSGVPIAGCDAVNIVK